MAVKKLIEVALPLEKINAESAREKSIRHGHPSTLHLWWARRPLAAARATIWASLVDDPSSHPELYPTEAEQHAERDRLFGILEKFVVWENSLNDEVLKQAKEEILKSTGGKLPAFLDPFAGGGALPLEASRLGLETHAHDLNPVAVMLNKAMIEIPPRFAGLAPVNPDARDMIEGGWKAAHGLAEDVRYYGEYMKRKAFKKIGHLYPQVKLPDNMGGGEATVIAWIWARTVKCPNPACGCEMPLAASFVLSKKKGNEAYIEPIVEGNSVKYEVHYNGKPSVERTVSRTGANCIKCGSTVPLDYIREAGKQGHLSCALMAIVSEGQNGRYYLSPDHEQMQVAEVSFPSDIPDTDLPEKALSFRVQVYGFRKHFHLFTPRQLTALTTFSDLVQEVQQKVAEDAMAAGLAEDGLTLADGGRGPLAYSQAIAVYLALAVDKMADRCSSICSWDSSREGIRNTFGRQAIPMVWDYAEVNPFSDSSGCFDNMLEWVVKCVQVFPVSSDGEASQHEAQTDCGLRNIMISTDPPYYDNIGYADLSDYFYVWMRRSLRNIYPDLFRTMLVPKNEELIVTPYRHEGSSAKAKVFFEEGMSEVCRKLYLYADPAYPVTIFYAYKQSDSSVLDEKASSGWETMLSAIIKAGFAITGTWPMRTEMANRSVASGTNALASSIVLVCRRRPEQAPAITRRDFIKQLRKELRDALKKLQDANIAPVDLAQSAIGPGMGVFSRYAQVLDADGTPMTVRGALQVINQELDVYFNESDGELDRESRFCVEVYTQYAFSDMKFGEAETLARAKNTSAMELENLGLIKTGKGLLRLLDREEIASQKHHNNCIWTLAQRLTHALETGGIKACADLISKSDNANCQRAKDLAYRLYTIAENKRWPQEAFAYNSLVTEWPDIILAASSMTKEQMDLF